MTTRSGHSPEEDRIEQLVGNLLRVGVLIAAAVGLIGGVAYLAQHASTVPDYRHFNAEASALRSLGGIFSGAAQLQSAAIIQLGIVLLIATPITRVLLALFAFASRKDWMYVAISGVVLALLAYGLLGGKV